MSNTDATPAEASIVSLLDAAKAFIVNGDLKSALDKLNIAIAHHPRSAIAYVERGTLYAIMGNERKAFADFDKGAELEPDLPEPYIRRSSLYHKHGKLDAALADYSKAIALGANSSSLYNNRAEVYLEQGDTAAALRDFQQAHQAEPEAIMIRAGLALACHACGDVAAAQTLWRALIASDERYKNWNWTGEQLNWRPILIKAAQKLIKTL